MPTLCQMVATGRGVTLLPESAVALEGRPGTGLTTRPFREPAPSRTIGSSGGGPLRTTASTGAWPGSWPTSWPGRRTRDRSGGRRGFTGGAVRVGSWSDGRREKTMGAATSGNAGRAGTIDVGGDLTVNRLGFGAMRITGNGIWGEPADRDVAKAVLRRAVELGVNFIDTADAYGPDVSES
jgi:hypothetical protein